MGDRANVYFKQAGVCLYTHWCGSELAVDVRNALRRGKDRWSDFQYLTRIVFCTMVNADIMGTTGYGITHEPQDNERAIIVVNEERMEVSLMYYEPLGGAWDPDHTKTHYAIPFGRFVEMTDDEVRAWHEGTE
jgi:hypothetical protein